MALRSTPVEPRPIVPLTCTSALVWRRLPLTSTSTWSGPRPRRVAGRTVSVPSVIVGRGKLNDGASASMIWLVSEAPVVSMLLLGEDLDGHGLRGLGAHRARADGQLLEVGEAESEVGMGAGRRASLPAWPAGREEGRPRLDCLPGRLGGDRQQVPPLVVGGRREAERRDRHRGAGQRRLVERARHRAGERVLLRGEGSATSEAPTASTRSRRRITFMANLLASGPAGFKRWLIRSVPRKTWGSHVMTEQRIGSLASSSG